MMKGVFKNVSLLLTLLWMVSACQVTLRHEQVEPIAKDQGLLVVPAGGASAGLSYALPATGLRFYVTAEKIEKKRGDFYLYSERYLGLSDVILEDEVEWKIKSISLSCFGVPSDLQFVVPSSVRAASNFCLSEDGLLLGINDQVLDLEDEQEKSVCDNTSKVVPYTEEMLLANSTAKMAQEAARYIYQLRESRTALISSDLDVAPADGLALKESIEQIAKTEKQFVDLFAGTITRSCVHESIDVVPEELGDKMILFRFSSFNGMVGKDDLSGSPIYFEMKETYRPEAVNLPDTAGLYFVQPAKINVALYDGRSQILDEMVSMAQFGVVNCLPKGYINDDLKMRFYPCTGAIKAISKE